MELCKEQSLSLLVGLRASELGLCSIINPLHRRRRPVLQQQRELTLRIQPVQDGDLDLVAPLREFRVRLRPAEIKSVRNF